MLYLTTHTHTHTYTKSHARMHARTHTHIHTHTHAHTHLQELFQLLLVFNYCYVGLTVISNVLAYFRRVSSIYTNRQTTEEEIGLIVRSLTRTHTHTPCKNGCHVRDEPLHWIKPQDGYSMQRFQLKLQRETQWQINRDTQTNNKQRTQQTDKPNLLHTQNGCVNQTCFTHKQRYVTCAQVNNMDGSNTLVLCA